MSPMTRRIDAPATRGETRVHPPRRRLAEAAGTFLADCRARALSPRTIEQYWWSIRRFAGILPDEEPVLADLEPAAVRAWIEDLKGTRAPTSVRSAVRALKVFSAWTAREGYVRSDPLAAVALPQAPQPLILPMSGGQVAALMAVGSPVLRASVALLADTGLRASELCGLTVGDVHERFLFVSGKGGHERLAPFGAACSGELGHYVRKSRGLPEQADEPLLLTESRGALTPHRLGELMRTAGREAGIRGFRVSPHTLRHTFAIEFLRNGGGELALQKALGHRSLDMVRMYAELTDVDLANAHAGASPLDRWREAGALGHQTKGRRPTRSSSRSRGESRVWWA